MNDTTVILAWIAIIITFVIAIVYRARKLTVRRLTGTPEHIPMDEFDIYSAQEVYDWTVFCTRAIGNAYIYQLQWLPTCKHAFLLYDLRATLRASNEPGLLQMLREVGQRYRLDTSMVDKPL